MDISGGRKPLLTLLSLSVLGMLGLTLTIVRFYPAGFTPGMCPLVMLFVALSGCGIATFSVGIGQVSYWHPKAKQGKALGIYGGVGNLAPGIFTLILSLAQTALGLAGAYLAWLVILIAGTALYYVYGINAPYFQLRGHGLAPEEARRAAAGVGQVMFPAGNVRESLVASARVWQTWVLVAIYFSTFGGFIALTSWLPTYWKSFMGAQSVMLVGALTAAYSIAALLFRVWGGSLSDRLGGERTVIMALVAMLAGSMVMIFSYNFGLSIAADLVMALGMGVANAAVFKLVPKEVPQAVGGASGWVGGLGAFGGFAIPPILGYIVNAAGKSGYAIGYVTYVLLALVSLGFTFALSRSEVRSAARQASVGADAVKS